MTFKVTLEEEDISFIKDIIYDITNNLVSDYKVRALFRLMPNLTKIKALEFGLDDPDVKELVYNWIENQYHVNKLKVK
jgi:hypothetical protein